MLFPFTFLLLFLKKWGEKNLKQLIQKSHSHTSWFINQAHLKPLPLALLSFAAAVRGKKGDGKKIWGASCGCREDFVDNFTVCNLVCYGSYSKQSITRLLWGRGRALTKGGACWAENTH